MELVVNAYNRVQNNSSLKFIIIFGLLFLAWKTLFYFVWRMDYLLDLYNQFSLWVIQYILIFSKALLNLIGIESEIVQSTRLLKIKNTVGVTVGEPCIGFEVMAVFVGLLISSKFMVGTKRFLIFLLLGLLIINFANTIRVALLAYLVQFNPYLWHLNHKYIFTIVILITVFLLWMKYLNNFQMPKQKV